jgi:DNA polymerase-1
VWVVDFEFSKDEVGRPDPICLAAHELISGRQVSLWRDQMGVAPPYDIGEDAIFACYSGNEAELACHLALSWPLPANVVDLITEYRLAICGRGNEKSLGLLAALARFDILAKVDAEEKKRAQRRCIAGGQFEPGERAWIQSYCNSDAEEECELLRALGPPAVSPHAIWRGEFTKAIARMWWRGVPIDPRFRQLAADREAWPQLLGWIIDQHRADFPVYDGNTLKADAYAEWLTENDIPVPRTRTGRPSLSLDVLAALAREYPVLAPFEEGRRMLGQLHEFPLPICADNRLRTWFAPFWTITSRAAPPTNGYVYSLPSWMRAMIQPPPGMALAYLDYEAMEFGLAAALSGDENMVAAYNSGDPYIWTGVAFGGLPPDATKKTHPELRGVYKTGGLACIYGIGASSLAGRIKRSRAFAGDFLKRHHRTFAQYWRWSDGVVAEAIRRGMYTSRHGWRYRVRPPLNIRSLRNWPVQTTGADILRCAVIFADTIGVEMLATAHDAVLIQAPEERIEQAAGEMAECMTRAALLLTDGFPLRVEIDIKRANERFIDPRGKATYALVEKFLAERGDQHAA